MTESTITPLVMTDSRYRLLVRSLSQVQTDALVRLLASGNIGPADSRTITALEDRELIARSGGEFVPTERGILLVRYIAQAGVDAERRRPERT